MDFFLYTIRWDYGDTAKLYYSDFICLGPFHTLADYQAAIRRSAAHAKLTRGPKGGFRGFEMTVEHEGMTLRAVYGQRETGVFRRFIEPCLQSAGIQYDTVQLDQKPRKKRLR